MAKLEALSLGDTVGKDFTFTRQTPKGPRDIVVHIRALSAMDLDRARVNAEIYADHQCGKIDGTKGAPTRDEILADARDIEVLALALRDPEKPDECWAGSGTLRGTLSTNEIALLLRAYNAFQDEVGPLFSTLTDERYEAMLSAIAQRASADPLVLYDSRTQKDFITTTVLELLALRMAKSSTTSESSEPSSPSEASDEQKPNA